MKRLNLGCGYDIMPGWVNTDIADLPFVNVVHDLDVGPWPWEDGEFSEIRAMDVFEHVDNPILFMNECWRILKPGGFLRIRSPHFRHENAFIDPTHRRYCSIRTWEYWTEGTEFHQKYGRAYCNEGVSFRQVNVELIDGNSNIALTLRRADAQ